MLFLFFLKKPYIIFFNSLPHWIASLIFWIKYNKTTSICSFYALSSSYFINISNIIFSYSKQTNKLNCTGLAKPTQLLCLILLQKTSSWCSTAGSLWKAKQMGLHIARQVLPITSQGSFQHTPFYFVLFSLAYLHSAGVSLSSFNTLCTSRINMMPTGAQTIAGPRIVGKSDT